MRVCQVQGTSIQQSNDNFTVCTKLKILNFKATRTEFPVLCIGTICCTLITLTVCACLGCEILAPMCKNNQWQWCCSVIVAGGGGGGSTPQLFGRPPQLSHGNQPGGGQCQPPPSLVVAQSTSHRYLCLVLILSILYLW